MIQIHFNNFPFQYSCLDCNIFDGDEGKQYHCGGCRTCRVEECLSFFNCPFCKKDENVFNDQFFIPICGHLVHRKCYDSLNLTSAKND